MDNFIIFIIIFVIFSIYMYPTMLMIEKKTKGVLEIFIWNSFAFLLFPYFVALAKAKKKIKQQETENLIEKEVKKRTKEEEKTYTKAEVQAMLEELKK